MAVPSICLKGIGPVGGISIIQQEGETSGPGIDDGNGGDNNNVGDGNGQQTPPTNQNQTPPEQTVDTPEREPVSINITNPPTQMKVGDTVRIPYIINNADANTVVQWGSSNKDVAIVDSSGEVTALSPGTVEITASVGDIKSSALITVGEINAESITISVKEFTATDMLFDVHEIKIGDKLHLSAVIEPKESKAPDLVWELSDPKVASLDSKQVLKALKEGEFTVTLRDAEGKLTDEMAFRVSKEGNRLAPILLISFSILLLVIAAAGTVFILIKRRKSKDAKEKRDAEDAKDRKKSPAQSLKNGERQPEGISADDQAKEPVDRATRIFNPEDAVGNGDRNRKTRDLGHNGHRIGNGEDHPFENAADDEPDRPFSLDDIE
jgi:hypothetical protein